MSASDQRRQQQTGEATGTRSAGVDWRRMAALAPWLTFGMVLFAVDTRLELFERLYEATRTYEEWQLDELLSLLLCAGIVGLFMLGFRTRQLSREIARRETAERLAHDSARHDPLTGLANSRRFREEIKATIGNAETSSSGCAVIYIDLDGFKPVNDTHGHAVGDTVLVEVARRITQAAPKGRRWRGLAATNSAWSSRA